MLNELFNRFTREKLLLENVSPRTVKFYQQCFKAFKATMGDELPDRFVLNEFIIRLREKGYSAEGINVCIRGMNSFLTWLWKINHISEKLRMKELRTEQNVDTDNLLVKVTGKGNKERYVPISYECRKVLVRYLQSHHYELVFCTRSGTGLTYRNAFRYLHILCKKVGVEKPHFTNSDTPLPPSI